LSTILAVDAPTYIVLAADLRYTKHTGPTFVGSSKVFQVTEDAYISYTGAAYWDAWVMNLVENAPKRLADIPIPEKYMWEVDAEAARDMKWFFDRRPETDFDIDPPTVVIATPRGIFLMDACTIVKVQTYQIGELELAVVGEGSGGELAKGAFSGALFGLGEDFLQSSDFLISAVEQAIRIAALSDPHTGGGISIRMFPKVMDPSRTIIVDPSDEEVH